MAQEYVGRQMRTRHCGGMLLDVVAGRSSIAIEVSSVWESHAGNPTMESERFDAHLRALADVRSRRGLTRFLGILTMVGPLGLLDLHETDAKPKKHRKHKHRSAVTAPCIPQDPAVVCAVGCGTRRDNCGG